MRQTTEQKTQTHSKREQTNSVDCPKALERKELAFVPAEIIALRTPLLVTNPQRLREKTLAGPTWKTKYDNSYIYI